MGLTAMQWNVEAVESVDHAFEILQKDIVSRGVLLDVMMDAGELLKDSDHRGGLWTGLRFIERGLERELFTEKNIVVLTNSGDRILRNHVESIGVRFENKIDFMGYKSLNKLISDCFDE